MNTIGTMIEEALAGSVGKAQKLPNMGTPHVVYKTVAVADLMLTLQPSCQSRRTGKPIPGINKGHTQGEPSSLCLLVNPTDLEVESAKDRTGHRSIESVHSRNCHIDRNQADSAYTNPRQGMGCPHRRFCRVGFADAPPASWCISAHSVTIATAITFTRTKDIAYFAT